MKNFSNYILGAGCFILAATLIYMAFIGPKTVEIDEKHFSCTQTNTKGIEATCTQYTAVSWLR